MSHFDSSAASLRFYLVAATGTPGGQNQMAYRGQVQLTQQQMRAAIEALPFEVPKLSATAITSMDERSFAAQLDRAIERSKSPPPLLNGPVEQLPPSAATKPFPRSYRRA